jgi:Mn-dependent DtxR family transcriptional regulator
VTDIYARILSDYVETLQQLTHRQVEALRVIAVRQTVGRGASLKEIAVGLRVRPPSALAHLGPLEQHGLISRFRGKSRLTEKGNRTLQEYQRHHRVAETLFGNLGIGPKETCAAAHEIDLAISHRTVDEICRAQRHPAACPHGAPIAPCHSSVGSRGS